MDGTPEFIKDLIIQDLSRGGAGVGRDASGRVVFVHGTAPGDRVRVKITEEKKRYAQAELLEVLERSILRVEPQCKVFGRCGGCQWQHLPYELQWKTKVQGALHALARVGFSLPESLPREEFQARFPWGYRNRIQLRGGAHGVGFYARGSHEIVPVDRCEIARQELNEALPELAKEAKRLASQGFPSSKVEVQINSDGQIQTAWNARHASLGFRQVNDEQNLALQQWIQKKLKEVGACRGVLYDLYGGSGNLSLPMASQFSQVFCVDTGAPQDSAESSVSAGWPSHVRFYKKEVSKWLKGAVKLLNQPVSEPGVIIMDPPRQGCGDTLPQLLDFSLRSGVSHWIAVGCDPDAWAGDLWRITSTRSWKIDALAFFDFFPQTVHLESVALLSRV